VSALRLRLLSTVLLASTPLFAAGMHPIERRVREAFPSVSLRAAAAFERGHEIVGAAVVEGWHARFAAQQDAALRVSYPRVFSDPLIATAGEQRVVLRSTRASAALAEESGSKLIYQ